MLRFPKGTVKTSKNTVDYTQYTSFMCVNNLNYYFTLYTDPTITRVSFTDFNLDNKKPIIKELNDNVVFSTILG